MVDLAAAYGGAVITVEGHSDPLGYLKSKNSVRLRPTFRRQGTITWLIEEAGEVCPSP